MIHCITILFGYRKFTDEYVNKLFRGIKANTSKEFLFTCFTDRYGTNHTIQEGIEVRPLPIETGDWYSKIGLYNEELYNPNDQISIWQKLDKLCKVIITGEVQLPRIQFRDEELEVIDVSE